MDVGQTQSLEEVPRWELYRLLADSVRLRVLALVAQEELAVGELAELLGEGQPKISRHGSALREASLVDARKNGTWVLYKMSAQAARDPVVRDAVAAGRRLLLAEGTLARVDDLIRARDSKSREFFSRVAPSRSTTAPRETLAYLVALGALLDRRALAVDAGTGDGSLLGVLAPVFERVIAIDRSSAQLAHARSFARARGLDNVDFVEGELTGDEACAAVFGCSSGADLVYASRVLHHAPKPEAAIAGLAALLAPRRDGRAGGSLVVLDYEPHEDLALRDAQADLWMGFDAAELVRLAENAGLDRPRVLDIPEAFRSEGADGRVGWHVLVAHAR
ncbi:MAG: metalloregulator ArsR/SmtB family transcription factor [Polyangiaceae bacterium]